MKNIKIIAHYLPQFYDVSENNYWWWEWFTEWTNVKKATPLFNWHNQPRVPLDNNYYTTLDFKTRKQQAEIAKKYWIDWFCYYHYWFKWWKLLLEKPAELLLKDWEPNIPFCFSWWNGNWARTWEWQPEEILMKQEYWDEEDWEKHFNYLLPFFQSPLYIRKNNKPIFLIHYSKDMKNIIEKMINKWNELAKNNWIEWIYIVETITSAQDRPYANNSNAILEFEPLHSIKNKFNIYLIPNIIKHIINRIYKKHFHKWLFLNKISYENVWKIITNKKSENNQNYKNKDIIYWWFVWWDNSPRKWKDSLIMNNCSPKIFWKYFNIHYKNAIEKKIDFIFLNAWNEWAEWAYLEPDEKNQFWYLEAIKSIKK